MKIYVIFDRVADSYEVPFVSHSDDFVKRALFDLAAHKPDITLVQHPSDFDLISLGEFDQKSGVFLSERKFVCHCSDVICARGAAVGGAIPPQAAERHAVTSDDADSKNNSACDSE